MIQLWYSLTYVCSILLCMVPKILDAPSISGVLLSVSLVECHDSQMSIAVFPLRHRSPWDGDLTDAISWRHALTSPASGGLSASSRIHRVSCAYISDGFHAFHFPCCFSFDPTANYFLFSDCSRSSVASYWVGVFLTYVRWLLAAGLYCRHRGGS